MVTGEQLRAARALLKLGTRDLAALAGVDKMAVVRAESGSRKSFVGTIEKLREALETAGAVFLPGKEGEYHPTAALRWGIGIVSDHQEHADDKNSKPDRGLHSHAWDDEFEDIARSETSMSDNDRQFLEYVRTAPHLSDRGRLILLRDVLKR